MTMDASLIFTRLKTYGIKGGLSILDQGLYSGTNFIATLLLARWQHPDDYGAFSIAFATFIFFSGIYNGFILEPISILGPSRFSANQEFYLSSQIWIHFLVTIPLSILFSLIGLFLNSPTLVNAFLAASIALPFMFLTWLARRTFYSVHQPLGAVSCSSLYAATLLISLWIIGRNDSITVVMIFAVMSIAGMIGGSPLLVWNFRYQKMVVSTKIPLAEIISAHWNLGKWIVIAALLFLASEQLPIIFVASLQGLHEAGGLRAIQNFILPVMQVQAAISLIGLPALSREYSEYNLVKFRRLVVLLVTAMTGLALVNEAVVFFLGDVLEKVVYDGQYSEYSEYTPYFGLIPIFIGLFYGFFLPIRAIQRSEIYWINGVVSCMIGVPLTYLLTKSLGVPGAISGLIIMYVFVFIINLYLYLRWLPSAKLKTSE